MAIPFWLKRFFIADLEPHAEPFSLGTWEGKKPIAPPAPEPETKALSTAPPSVQGCMTANLDENTKWLKQHLNLSLNRGIVLRPLRLGVPAVDAMIIYTDDQINWEHLNRTVLMPLLREPIPRETLLDFKALEQRVVTEGRVILADQWQQVVDFVLMGHAVLLVDGVAQAMAMETKGWAMRSVDRPNTEITVIGPQESLIEDIRSNVSLIRKRLRSPDLIVEWGLIGRVSRTDIALLYLKSVANPQLVKEVRRRIQSIDIDYLNDTGTLEQLIEDHPFAIYPSTLATERPDRVAGQISQGYVGVLVANDSFALILPSNIPMFLHSAEDTYLRWPYAAFIRLVRTAAFFMSLLLPSIYVAIATFHQEMIPTALMLAISGSRETVPIPVVAEVLFMEIMFELIREAGVRLPSVMGPTIGIVGALILGQAAVQAGVISPIMVIITSATALASFAIPNYSLQYAARILRFAYVAAGATLGLFGIMLLFFIISLQAASMNTFGVPWLAPVTPLHSWRDAMIRFPPFLERRRPRSVRPKDPIRMDEAPRAWERDAALRPRGANDDAHS